jgi:hypothetical protein
MTQLAGHLAFPSQSADPHVGPLMAHQMRNQRRGTGQTAHVGATRSQGPLTQHVMRAKQNAMMPGSPQNGGDGSGVDTGDDSVQTTAQLGELGGADLHNAGQVSKWDATAQNYLPVQPPVQQQAAPVQQAAAPQPKPANPYVGMPTQDLMNVPIKPQPMEIVRGTGPTAQTSTFDPETHEETAQAPENDFLNKLNLSKEDQAALQGYAQQPGVKPQQVMTAANEFANREASGQRSQARSSEVNWKDYEGWKKRMYPAPTLNQQMLASQGLGTLPQQPSEEDMYKAYQSSRDGTQPSPAGDATAGEQQNASSAAAAPQQAAPPQGAGAGKRLDHSMALQFYQQAGGDPNKARALARQAGYQF